VPPEAPDPPLLPPVALVVDDPPLPLQPAAIGIPASSTRMKRCVFGIVFMTFPRVWQTPLTDNRAYRPVVRSARRRKGGEEINK